ncbi:MAG: hypothetical protein CVU98_10680 [Firmicutes bacterium HGW-Firmicutes-3]|jgi:uncharacterized membrane protein HdeD (DUF308 family)|nr:MAG: hypothetical protein CVU98_10680 [Firmicutes bacterium HGW-Firmicutes-3]
MNKMRVSSSTVFGIILIAVGIISLLSSLGYVESWDLYSTFWPLILILLGIKHLVDYQSSNLFGLILILIGTLFQLDNLNIMYFKDLSVGEMMIPMIIILIGLSFIIPKGDTGKKKSIIEAEAAKVEEVVVEGTTVGEKVDEKDITIE